jgi:nitrogen fixation/metabolism regulation signal transduction histidine kinase
MTSASRSLVLGLTARAVILSALLCVLALLLLRTQLYATMLVLAIVMAMIGADLVKVSARAVSHEKTASRDREKENNARRLQTLEALLDTVPAALLVAKPDGSLRLMNHAARELAGAPVARLRDIPALGEEGAALISALSPGSRQILRLKSGLSMHLSVLQFRSAGEPAERLVALQRIAGELDAVEVKAWQDVSSVLTHEIMSSLTPIASLSESLESLLRSSGQAETDLARNEEISGALEAIKRRSHGLMSFVERYRAVAEIPQPNRREIEAQALLAGIGRLMSAAFRERGIDYQSAVEEPGLRFTADAELLEQAVINLLSNAVDAVSTAGERGPPRVRVACAARGDEVVISVSDNGPGLNDAEKDRIFVPFFTTKANGKGIGLSLARHVALAHDGRIEVHSDRETGTMFSLILPAAATAQGAHSIGR